MLDNPEECVANLERRIVKLNAQEEAYRAEIARLRSLLSETLRSIQSSFRDPYPRGEDK